MIDLVTFTGVDGRTPMTALVSLAERYPRTEFGVLVGSHTGEFEHPIFPDLSVVNALKEIGRSISANTAIHLCGSYSRGVMSEDGEMDALYSLCEGFGRVQVNLHGDTFSAKNISVNARAVERFADNVVCGSVILQHRGRSWQDVPVLHEKVEYLFDVSEGRGMESFEHWPVPSADFARTGYAGGLGPHNIERAVAFAQFHDEHVLWFDMEGRIRTDGWLNTDTVEAVCRLIWR